MLALMLAVSPSGAVDCDDWHSKRFFDTASPVEVRACLAAGADPMAWTEEDATPLHMATLRGTDPDAAMAFLEAGADPNARADGGETALHLAAVFAPNPDVIEILIDAGADPMAQDNGGRNVWDMVQENDVLRHTEVYERLRTLAGK